MHFVIRYHTGLDPEQAARRAIEYLQERGYSRNSPAEPFVRDLSGSGVLTFTGGKKKETAWLIPEASTILGSTIRVEMEVEAENPLFLRKDRDQLYHEIAGIGESLLTEDYQGSCSPWPITTYFNLPLIVLAALGLLLGIVTAYVMEMQLFVGALFSLAAASSLSSVGLKLERKRQLALEERQKIRQTYTAPAAKTVRKDEPVTGAATRITDAEAASLESRFKKELHLWAICCGLLSIPAFISTRLESFWGLALIAVAVMFFIFPAPAMLVVSGVILIWAGISTAFGGGLPAWILAGAFIFLGWRILRSYKQYAPIWEYYQVNLNYPGLPQPSKSMLRSSLEFPGLGAIFAIVGAIAGFVLLAFAFVQGGDFGLGPYGLLKTFALDFSIGLGMIGFALGFSSLISNYKQMLVSILTMIVSFVVVLEWVGYLMITVVR